MTPNIVSVTACSEYQLDWVEDGLSDQRGTSMTVDEGILED